MMRPARKDIIFIQYTSDAPPRVSFETLQTSHHGANAPAEEQRSNNSDQLEKSVHGENAPDAKGDEISEMNGGVTITIHDPIIDGDVEISADLLVLATGMTPSCLEDVKKEEGASAVKSKLDVSSQEASASKSELNASSQKDLASIFGIKMDDYHFYKQGDSKWRPVDSSREGIFLCGTAMGPRDVEESMTSARAAAMRAMRIVGLEQLSPSAVTAGVKTSLCSLCMKCVETCPYDARRFDEERRIIDVNGAMCQGCGACAAVCPNSASYLTDYSDQQMFERIDTAMGYFV